WPHPEADNRSGVAQHRLADLRRELVHVLMGEHQTHAVLPKLGQHPCNRERREALELVEVDEERTTRVLRHVRATQRGEAKSGYEQSPKKRAAIRPDTSL